MLLTKKKLINCFHLQQSLVFCCCIIWYILPLHGIFYLYKHRFFFFPSNLKHPGMGLSFRRTWNWNENNTCWCSCLVPKHITQPGCSPALGGLWCFLHLGKFSLLFFKKSFTLTRFGPFGSVQVPYCTHSNWEDKAGFKESFGTSLTIIPGVCITSK